MMNKVEKQKTNVIAVIPARGGSKGVPRKNIREMAGRPLIAYSIEAALLSGVVSRIIVSTEDDEIAQIAGECGAEVVRRPAELATDEAPTEPSLLHVINWLKEKENYRADIVILLQATSPMRSGIHIREAFEEFNRNCYDSLLSACPSHAFFWVRDNDSMKSINYDIRNRPRRQDVEPQYRENGAIYITKYEILIEKKNRLGGRIGLYEMNEEASIDVDTEYDFWLCEQALSEREQL